jgi:hypothetical protein
MKLRRLSPRFPATHRCCRGLTASAYIKSTEAVARSGSSSKVRISARTGDVANGSRAPYCPDADLKRSDHHREPCLSAALPLVAGMAVQVACIGANGLSRRS